MSPPAPPPPPPPPFFVDWDPPAQNKGPSRVHGISNQIAGSILGDSHLRRLGESEVAAAETRENMEDWQEYQRHYQREYQAEMIERAGWWNPKGWFGKKNKQHHHNHNGRAFSSVAGGSRISDGTRSHATTHRDPVTGDTVVTTRDGTRIEISTGKKRRRRGSRHRDSSRRRDEDPGDRLTRYRTVNPDFSGYYKRHWGHSEHRCRPHNWGRINLVFGFLLCNERMKQKGRAEREESRRERRKERRRRWALFKEEVRAHKRGERTMYSV